MAILRGTLPTDSFTIISNAWLRDPALSARAKGLLCYMASHAEGYVLTVAQMRREMKDGEDSIRSALADLEAAGYLTKERQRDDAGKLGAYEWTLGVSAGGDQTGLPSLGKASLGNPVTKKTTPEKTIKEDHQEPSFDAEASPTAQTIIKGFIDWLALPAQESVKLSKRVIGIYAKSIKSLLGEGFSEKLIKLALVEMHHRGMTGRPTLLEGFVVQVQQTKPVSGPPQSFKAQDEERKVEQSSQDDLILRAMQALLDGHPQMKAAEARKHVMGLIEAGELDLNALKTSAPTGYIEGDVIETGPREVTGS